MMLPIVIRNKNLSMRSLVRISRQLEHRIPIRCMSQVVPFKLADIGEGIAEVELMKWFVKAGDNVKAFDRICEVQSDKATVEITSRFDGIIAKVHHAEGDIVKVGSALVDIETKGGSTNSTTNKKLVNEPNAKELPAGSHYKPAATPTTAATASFQHSNDKILTTPAVRKLAKENNIDLSKLAGTGPKSRITKEDVLLHLQQHPRGGGGSSLPPATPLRTATGSSGKSHGYTAPSSSSSSSASASPSPVVHHSPAAVSQYLLQDQRVPIRGIQRLMVKSMTAANQVCHLTYCDEILCNALHATRTSLKTIYERENLALKLTFLPFFIKACSLALRSYPMLNATTVTTAGTGEVSEMIHHASHNIGVAMDTPKGLIVPVIRDVQRKSLTEISVDLMLLQQAAKTGTLTEAQLSGGTFSVSNIGSVGGTYATPVLVVPQVMIGAFGRQQVMPRYYHRSTGKLINTLGEIDLDEDGSNNSSAVVKPTSVMSVSWSADHRVVDGATVAKFSNLWKRYLEFPELMLAEMR